MSMIKKSKVHVIQLFENDCGTAVVVNILKYYGYNANYIKIREIVNNISAGTNVIDIKNFFNSCGFKCKLYKVPNKNRFSILTRISNENLPCILMLNKKTENHYVVLYKIYKNGKCLISDPAHSKLKKVNLREIEKEILLIISCKTENELVIPNDLLINTNKSLLITIIRKYIYQIICVLIISFLLVLVNLLISSIFGIIVDIILPNKEMISIFLLIIMFTIFSILSLGDACLKYFKFNIAQKMTNSIEKLLYKEYIYKILHLKYDYYQNIKSGEFITRLKEGIKLTEIVSTILTNSIVDILTISISLIILIKINVFLGIVILITSIICMLIIKVFFSKMIQNNYEISQSYADLDSAIISSLSEIESIKIFNNEEITQNKIDNLVSRFIDRRNINFEMSKNSMTYQNIIIQLSNVIILSLGAVLVSMDYISIGTLIIFINISSTLFTSILEIVGIQVDIETFIVGYKRFLLILNDFELDNDTNCINKSCNFDGKIRDIEFVNFSLGYGTKNLLNNINLKLFENYKNIVIYGESGCGKSSLVKSLIKINKNYTGNILINGINLNNINGNKIRDEIIYLSNIASIKETTIIDFLTDGKKITIKKVLDVCRDLNILNLIEYLPKQFNYVISDEAANISLGQKQRLFIARALLKNPSLIIFDETFSNIDLQNKKIILENLEKYNILKIFITHQELSLNKMKVFKFSNHKLIEREERG